MSSAASDADWAEQDRAADEEYVKGLEAEVARLREDVEGMRLSFEETLGEDFPVTGSMVVAATRLGSALSDAREDLKTARRDALMEAAALCDQYPASGTDAAEDIRALAGDKP